MASVAGHAIHINMDPGGSKVHITKVSVSGIDHILLHESPVLSWPGAAVWITDTNMASCAITGHGGLLRSPNPESEPFLSWESIIAQSRGDTAVW